MRLSFHTFPSIDDLALFDVPTMSFDVFGEDFDVARLAAEMLHLPYFGVTSYDNVEGDPVDTTKLRPRVKLQDVPAGFRFTANGITYSLNSDGDRSMRCCTANFLANELRDSEVLDFDHSGDLLKATLAYMAALDPGRGVVVIFEP